MTARDLGDVTVSVVVVVVVIEAAVGQVVCRMIDAGLLMNGSSTP